MIDYQSIIVYLPVMGEGLVECSFLIPIVRDSDRSPHPPMVWRLLQDAIRTLFPQGHSGPELMYKDVETVPGEYVEDAMKKMNKPLYRTITGLTLDLSKLTREERPFIAYMHAYYKNSVEWSKFAALWAREFDKRALKQDGLAYRICQDLEARLGIAQGKV